MNVFRITDEDALAMCFNLIHENALQIRTVVAFQVELHKMITS